MNRLFAPMLVVRREWRDARGISSIARRAYGKGVAFVHVPKCAGRSVERALRRSYRLSRGHAHAGTTFEHAQRLFPDADQHTLLKEASRLRSAAYAYHLSLGLRCVTGHAPVNSDLVKAYSENYVFVTVLRDPVQRLLSHFKYSYRSKGHGRIDDEIERFLETPRGRGFGSIYWKYFADGYSPDEAPEAALECLDAIHLVGFLDDIPGVQAGLRDLTGRRITIGHENPTGHKNRPKMNLELTDALKQSIAEICAPDQAIYDAARARYARTGTGQ